MDTKRLTKTYLKKAHDRCSHHKAEVEASIICGCFYCQKTFSPGQIKEWVGSDGDEALCPICGIDAVLGSASGLPVADSLFLLSMYLCYFGWGEGIIVKGKIIDEDERVASKLDPTTNEWADTRRPPFWKEWDFELDATTNTWQTTISPPIGQSASLAH